MILFKQCISCFLGWGSGDCLQSHHSRGPGQRVKSRRQNLARKEERGGQGREQDRVGVGRGEETEGGRERTGEGRVLYFVLYIL